MKFILCCDNYWPSKGGVQVVMQEIAERLVSYGHSVTIFTSFRSDRATKILNGVNIVEFMVSGNAVNGMYGEIEKYQDCLCNEEFDALLIKAVCQWTFDAAIPVLSKLEARKILIPCGFSALYEDLYKSYFKYLPRFLEEFNHFIFYATSYRDIEYCRQLGITRYSIVSNGASEAEFSQEDRSGFRRKHNIPEDNFLILTVGNLSGEKGHLELASSIEELPESGRQICLILNGNSNMFEPSSFAMQNFINRRFKRVDEDISSSQPRLSLKTFFRVLKEKKLPIYLLLSPRKFFSEIKNLLLPKLEKIEPPRNPTLDAISNIATHINNTYTNKRILVTDLPRDELIQAYYAADLFVFASHVEYSPLVLFEAAAAGTPFLTTDVGNAREIIDWLGGGFICESQVLENGNRIVNPKVLAQEIAMLMLQKDKLKEMGARMRKNWSKKYTWDHIAREYEKILMGIGCE